MDEANPNDPSRRCVEVLEMQLDPSIGPLLLQQVWWMEGRHSQETSGREQQNTCGGSSYGLSGPTLGAGAKIIASMEERAASAISQKTAQ